MFTALQYRNFRFYLAGQCLSLIGTGIHQIALAWLVFRLTHSTYWLGLAVFSSQAPVLFFSVFTGALADGVNPKRLLCLVQVMSCVVASIIGILVFTESITPLSLLAFNFCLGICTAFEMPTKMVFVAQTVDDRKSLPNAIALTSAVLNCGRVIGPAIGGFFISEFGEGFCFFANGASYALMLGALLMTKVTPKVRPASSTSLTKKLTEGFIEIGGNLPLRSAIILLATVSFFGMSYSTLLPAISKIVDEGPKALGLIGSTGGLGAVCGTLYLSKRSQLSGLGRVIGLFSTLLSLGLIFLSQARSIVPIVTCVFAIGLGTVVVGLSTSMMVQSLTADDNKRGRVMGIYTLALVGLAPLGGFLIGFLAQKIGVSNALLLHGSLCMTAAIIFCRQITSIDRVIEERIR